MFAMPRPAHTAPISTAQNHFRFANMHSERQSVRISTFTRKATGRAERYAQKAERLCRYRSSITISSSSAPSRQPKTVRLFLINARNRLIRLIPFFRNQRKL